MHRRQDRNGIHHSEQQTIRPEFPIPRTMRKIAPSAWKSSTFGLRNRVFRLILKLLHCSIDSPTKVGATRATILVGLRAKMSTPGETGYDSENLAAEDIPRLDQITPMRDGESSMTLSTH